MDFYMEKCRACLLTNHVNTMYDLGVVDTLLLYQRCTNIYISLNRDQEHMPQYLCSMCYRLCELWQGFRDRCQETDKILRETTPKKRKLPETYSQKQQQLVQDIELEVEAEEELEAPVEEQFEESENQEKTPRTKVEVVDDPLVQEWPEVDDVPYEESEPPVKHRRKPLNPPSSVPKRGPSINRRGLPVDTSCMTFGPGPNDRGVWQYFLRDETRRFGKCILDNCEKIVMIPNASTTGMRLHLRKVHDIHLDKGGKDD